MFAKISVGTFTRTQITLMLLSLYPQDPPPSRSSVALPEQGCWWYVHGAKMPADRAPMLVSSALFSHASESSVVLAYTSIYLVLGEGGAPTR